MTSTTTMMRMTSDCDFRRRVFLTRRPVGEWKKVGVRIVVVVIVVVDIVVIVVDIDTVATVVVVVVPIAAWRGESRSVRFRVGDGEAERIGGGSYECDDPVVVSVGHVSGVDFEDDVARSKPGRLSRTPFRHRTDHRGTLAREEETVT